jgi:hypothetical protein
MVLLPHGLHALKQVAKQVGLDSRGAYLNLDGGFDSAHNRKCIFNAGLIPNIKENPRNRKGVDHGVGHLVSRTAPDHPCLATTQYGNPQAPSPSLAACRPRPRGNKGGHGGHRHPIGATRPR